MTAHAIKIKRQGLILNLEVPFKCNVICKFLNALKQTIKWTTVWLTN